MFQVSLGACVASHVVLSLSPNCHVAIWYYTHLFFIDNIILTFIDLCRSDAGHDGIVLQPQDVQDAE